MTQPDKILITGASGFVGGFLVDEALKRGLSVDAAVRKTSNTDYLKDPRINLVYINLSDEGHLSELLSNGSYKYIIHNAGLTRSKKPQALFDVNAGSIKTFINALDVAMIDIDKFTFVSSLAAYGPADFTTDGLVQESGTPNPVTNYGESKLAGEKILKDSTLPYTIIRPTAVYGPREKDLLTLYQTINKGLQVHIGMTEQQLTFVYVKDLVKAIVDITLSSETHKKGYFITDGNLYSTTQLNNTVKDILQKKTLKLSLPISVMKGIAFLVENASKISGGFPPLNKEKVKELGARSWNCDIQPLQKDINFVADYDLKSGLKETIAWCKQNNWIK